MGHGPWVMVVKRGEQYKPRVYNGKQYRNVYEAARAMERDKGERVVIEVNERGYVVLPR